MNSDYDLDTNLLTSSDYRDKHLPITRLRKIMPVSAKMLAKMLAKIPSHVAKISH